MAWTEGNPVSIGDATKKTHYDVVYDNVDFVYTFLNDASLTDHGILLGSGTSPITPTAVMTDGQLLVGQSGADPLPKTTSGVTVAADGTMLLGAGSADQTVIGANAVGQSEIKTTSADVSVALPGTGETLSASAAGGEYILSYQARKSSTPNTNLLYLNLSGLTTSDANLKGLFQRTGGSPNTGYLHTHYVQASGELHWIYLQMENGKEIRSYQAPDHPAYGNRGLLHPFEGLFDPTKHEIILINPSQDDVERVLARMTPATGGGYLTREKSAAGVLEDITKVKRGFPEVFFELFEIQESKAADYPDIPVTIGLPSMHKGRAVDWRFIPQLEFDPETERMVPLKVKPMKAIMPKPDFVTPLQIKEKE